MTPTTRTTDDSTAPPATRLRVAVRWFLRLTLALVAVVALYVALLVFPTPLFAHQETFGAYRVYSDEPIPVDFADVMADVDRRVAAMEPGAFGSGARVYLCNSRRLYAFFAFLTRKTPDTLAIGLNVANETFVSVSRVEEFAALNAGALRHTRFEGNMAEVIAHEIAHFLSVRAVGYRAHLDQPVWKSEGWAEYQANIAAIRADPAYDLRARIDVLLDDRHWGSSVARGLWESQLLVEYLGEVENVTLADLLRKDVTRSSVMQRMMEWRGRTHRSGN